MSDHRNFRIQVRISENILEVALSRIAQKGLGKISKRTPWVASEGFISRIKGK